MKKVRMSIILEPSQEEFIKNITDKLKISRSAFIRIFIDFLIFNETNMIELIERYIQTEYKNRMMGIERLKKEAKQSKLDKLEGD